MATKQQDGERVPKCRRCEKALADRYLWSRGVTLCQGCNWLTYMERREAAEKVGSHSANPNALCQLCRNWVVAIYHVTLDHKSVCLACADLEKFDPDAYRAMVESEKALIGA